MLFFDENKIEKVKKGDIFYKLLLQFFVCSLKKILG